MSSQNSYSLAKLLSYFLKLGAFGFGGSVALVEYMRRDLVDNRGWLSHEQFLRGLALSQLAPGPLATQLAIFIGFVKNKLWGATLSGLAFVLPSFVMVIILAAVYRHYGGLAWMAAIFYGVGAAVIAVIAKSAYRLSRSTCGKKKLLWGIFAAMFAVTLISQKELFWFLVLSGIISWFYYAPPKFLNLGSFSVALAWPLAGRLSQNIYWRLFSYFFKASFVVFGSGLAIVPFLHSGVVGQFGWLTDKQFVDAVAVSMATPGPVVITVAFIGFLVAGAAGSIAAALGIFLPVWLFVVIITPYYERFADNLGLKAFVAGITAGACGAIAAAAILLGKSSLVDVTSAVIALVALFLLIKYKWPEPAVMLLAAVAGLIIRWHGF